MKGVSTIIAVILILLITVALAVLAYAWFTGIFDVLISGANQSINGTQQQFGTKFSIEAATNVTEDIVTISMRNIGTVNIDLDKIACYVDDELKTNDASGTLSPGSVASFNITAVSDPCSKVLRITVETGADETITISC